jgi:hypothetical protein
MRRKHVCLWDVALCQGILLAHWAELVLHPRNQVKLTSAGPATHLTEEHITIQPSNPVKDVILS